MGIQNPGIGLWRFDSPFETCAAQTYYEVRSAALARRSVPRSLLNESHMKAFAASLCQWLDTIAHVNQVFLSEVPKPFVKGKSSFIT